MLLELFDAAGGAAGEGTSGWTDASRWRQGEPCIGVGGRAWKGVTCCPEGQPSKLRVERLVVPHDLLLCGVLGLTPHLLGCHTHSGHAAQPAQSKPSVRPQYGCEARPKSPDSAASITPRFTDYTFEGGEWQCRQQGVGDLSRRPITGRYGGSKPYAEGGCSSGSSTGTAADAARCHPVAIDLNSNNLVGTLPEALCTLPYLQRLDVSGNSIGGTLPTCVAELDALDIGGNQFSCNWPPFEPGTPICKSTNPVFASCSVWQTLKPTRRCALSSSAAARPAKSSAPECRPYHATPSAAITRSGRRTPSGASAAPTLQSRSRCSSRSLQSSWFSLSLTLSSSATTRGWARNSTSGHQLRLQPPSPSFPQVL